MNPYVFREYDIRGAADTDLSEDFVRQLGLAVGTYFQENGVSAVSIGRDCRLSSPLFRDLMVEGLTSTGCKVYDLGVVPTPLLYFSLFNLDVSGGVMITGSHNPPDQNGFKICLGKSTIYGKEIQKVRSIIESGKFARGRGNVVEREIIPQYQDYLLKNTSLGKRGLNVVVDAGNGTGGVVATPIYRKMGVDVLELYCEPDGSFPHHHPDPTIPSNMEDLISTVKREKAHLGIAFDGDADRIGVVDENGEVVWGDRLMIIFSRSILKEVPDATFIGEVKCSQTLFDEIEKMGGRAIMWKVGHSLIKAKMKEEGAALAGEMSGHIFFSHRYFGYDDAIYAGARLLEILSKTNLTFSELLGDLPKMIVSPEIRLSCPDDKKFTIVEHLKEKFRKKHRVVDIDGARVIFEDGWGLIRPSNTQPVVVLRFEARSEDAFKRIRDELEGAFRALM